MTERLICVRFESSWQVTKRIGPFWSVGDFHGDREAAIRSATEKFDSDHPQLRPVAPPRSLTDLSDLLYN